MVSQRSALRRSRRIVIATYVVALAAAVGAGSLVDHLHPIWTAAVADLVATLVVFSASFVFRNSSLYDPYWSVAPPLIALFWAAHARGESESWRSLVVLGLVLWWSVRLTRNWVLRWQGVEDEDWRYVEFQRTQGRLYWLVSFSGIHFFPTVLVFLACLPLFVALSKSAGSLVWLDAVAAATTAGAIWLEGRADRQLRRHRATAPAGQTLTSGTWSLCRHPNYLGEIVFWWGLGLFGLAADPTWWWTLAGPLAILTLFVVYSIPAKERRMRERRPDYAAYAARTPLIIPRLMSRLRPSA